MLNSKINYFLTVGRAFSFWIYHLCFPGLIMLLFVISPNANNKKTFLLAAIIIAVLITLYGYLFLNHYKHAACMELVIGNKEITIRAGERSTTAPLSEVKEITEYASFRKSFWNNIIYWTFEIDEKKFIVSNLTISQADFERYFYNRITRISKAFPLITNSNHESAIAR